MNSRVLVWFSCGNASAALAKLSCMKYPETQICYCNTLAYEHPDNIRFLHDVEKWCGREVQILSSPKFKDIFEVFNHSGFLRRFNGGAPCTDELKRQVRKAYQQPGDLHLFGLTSEETKRIDRLEKENPDIDCDWILRDQRITKADCHRMVREAGIEQPAMYRLGYLNNNCIGCVKGGAGYWNKIKVDFPEAFDRMAKLERELGFALLTKRKKGVKRTPLFLDELPVGMGRYEDEPDIECGAQCVAPPKGH